MNGASTMPDTNGPLPPEGDPKFVAGIMWERLNGHDKDIAGHDADIRLLRSDIKTLGDSMKTALNDVVKEVRDITNKQTEELKPLLIDKAARDLQANDDAKALSNTNTRVQIGYFLIVASVALCGACYTCYQWGKAQIHQMSSITVTNTPQGTTTVKGTGPTP